MNINFGRPDLSDVFEQRKPKQVNGVLVNFLSDFTDLSAICVRCISAVESS